MSYGKISFLYTEEYKSLERWKQEIYQGAYSCKTTFKVIIEEERRKRQKYVGLSNGQFLPPQKNSFFLCLQMMVAINHQSYPSQWKLFFCTSVFHGRARKKAEQIYPCECCLKLHRPYWQNVHQSFTTSQHIAFPSLFTRNNYSKSVIFFLLKRGLSQEEEAYNE